MTLNSTKDELSFEFCATGVTSCYTMIDGKNRTFVLRLVHTIER